MNKLVAVLGIIIISLSIVCGIAYYQIGDIQSQNSELQNQISQLENQTSELESQLDELEAQNLELENQTEELEEQINNASNANQVQITRITFTRTSSISLLLNSNITVTVKNFGTNNVSGLSVRMKDSNSGDYFGERTLETLKAGESQNVTVGVTRVVGDYIAFVTRLMRDNVILDEIVDNYSGSSYSHVY